MRCEKCNNDLMENEIEEHHLHPRFMDNRRGLGKKVYLCKKCHHILHLTIPSIIWNFVPNKEECIRKVIEFTENNYSKKEEEKGDNGFLC